MPKAKIAARQPVGVELEARNHAWCSCGRSNTQPMCDGSHAGSGLRPCVFKPQEPTTAWLCMCKQTKNPPYCDGSHNALPLDVDELETPGS